MDRSPIVQPELPAQLLDEMAARVEERLGLSFPIERRGELARGIARAAAANHCRDAAHCARWLRDNAISPHQLAALAAHLTPGETYFWRDPASFEALRRSVLPGLVQRRRSGSRRLRIWSAGCSTGEEAYSLAMLLELAIADLDQWELNLLATDINPRALQIARRGVYREWSFRGVPQELRERFFRPRPDGLMEVLPHLRRRVSFARLNLADDVYPAQRNDTQAMDLIVCRNVLMYFAPAQAARVLDRFANALVDGGWLLLGAAETGSLQGSCAALSPVDVDGCFLLRRNGDRGSAAAAPDGSGNAANRSQAPPPPLQPAPAADPAEMARLARGHADRGRLDAALDWSQRAIAAAKLDPGVHYLHANILLELGRRGEATASLERALFLDHDFTLAHYALGMQARTDGMPAHARRHLRNALASLARRDASQAVSDGNGITVGRLAAIIGAMGELTATPG